MNINVNNISQHEAVIDIEGTIGLGGSNETNSVSTYEQFREQIVQIQRQGVEKIRINIRSSGGSVEDALLIHSTLCELQGTSIETHCYGYVASAATIIAQAASQGQRFIASTALYLIHNAWTTIDGNAIQAESTAALLTKTDEQIAAIYALRSGYSPDHFRALMAKDSGKGEWLDASQVIELGLADQVENISPIKNAVEKIRNFLNNLIDTPQLKAENKTQTEPIAIAPKPIKAIGTQTLAKEDPKIESDAVSLTANQKSYIQDIELFRE